MSTPAPTGRSRAVVAVLALGGIVATVVQTAIVPLLPELPRITGSSAVDVSWLITVTLLTAAVSTPLLGRAGDMYGRRRMLLLSLASLTAGSVLCGFTSDLVPLLIGRGLQGVGAAVVPLSISILRGVLPPERTGSAVALMSSTVGIGAALGVPLAALLVQYADWHAMFWATTALGALVFALTWFTVTDVPSDEPGRFDVVGAVGLSAGLVALLMAVSKGGDWGWTSARTLGVIGAAVVVLLAWGRHQWGAASPLVDMRLVARPAVLLPHLAALLAGFAFYANTLVTAQLVQAPEGTGYGLGLSVVAAGLCLLPSGVCMVLCAPISARISAARGAGVTLALGAGVIAAGYVVRFTDSRDLWAIVTGATIVSMGTALAYSALPMLVMRAVPMEQTAAANGLNVLMRTIGQAFCSATVASVLASHAHDFGGGVVAPTLGGYRTAFVIAGTAAVVACVTACCLPRHPRQPRPEESEIVVGSPQEQSARDARTAAADAPGGTGPAA
ncbi:MFS transporter [Yinghuangia sp. ASG 101]|uniref:MFS transporter n=1 Tax=Yinghuangia sp. ASG 101 TaxID=2896848 RepID=UPI001E55026E|nr:MFS transporter [Yinghuangia sp. ASG 101]UGQ12581.1 MFS transporter [Yinghuangia sp. ASG 101]